MFDLTQYTKAYIPSFNNSARELTFLENNNGFPIRLQEEHVTVTSEGKIYPHDANPIVFPYSQEWYDKLKLAYPNLEPYKDDPKEILKLIEQRVSSVACRISDKSYEDARKRGIVVFKESDFKNIYYIPINPFTLKECKTVEDYFIIPSNI